MAHERTRVFIGNDINGRAKYTQVSGRNQDERNDNIVLKYIESGRIWEMLPPEVLDSFLPKPAEPPKHPFAAYAEEWYKRYKSGSLEANTRLCVLYTLNGQRRYFGNKPIEALDDLLKQVKSMGVQDVIDAYQSAYTRFLNR